MNIKKTDVCTASLALALALQPWHIASAASHCKGLEQAVCGNMTACRWIAEREPAFGVSKRKAHCRLDVKAAAELAAKASGK